MLQFFTRKWSAIMHAGCARFTLPPVVYEIAPGFVAAARLDGSGRQKRRIRSIGVEPINTQTLAPHLSRANVADAEDLRRATGSLMSTIGNGGGRYGLIVPDGAVRVAVLSFESLPDDPLEAEALIRWRMKDKLPYNPEEARATFQVLSSEPGHMEVLAIAVRAAVLAEYETALAPSNDGAALILPATVALLPLLSEGGARGQLLLHVCANWMTATVVAGAGPCVWRARELEPEAMGSRAREVASEAVRVLASARDRLQADLGRACLCVRPQPDDELVSAVSSAVGRKVELMTPRVELGALLSSSDRAVFEQFGATVAGLVANVG